MELERIKCTKCGGEFTDYDPQASVMQCSRIGCGATFVIRQGREFAKVQIDHETDIANLRSLLMDAVGEFNPVRMEDFALDILKLIPEDAIASYCDALGKKKIHRKFSDYTQYLKTAKEMTLEDATTILSIALNLNFFTSHDVEPLKVFIRSNFPKELWSQKEELLRQADDQYLEVQNRYANIPRDVFICHSSTDPIAMEVYSMLGEEGIDCWISQWNMPPNTLNYWLGISQAIKKCEIFLVIASKASMGSPDCVREMEWAQELQKKRLELKIDDKNHTVYFKYFFNGLQWIRLGGNKENAFNELKERIHFLLHPPIPGPDRELFPEQRFLRFKIKYLDRDTQRVLDTHTLMLQPGPQTVRPDPSVFPKGYQLDEPASFEITSENQEDLPEEIIFYFISNDKPALLRIQYLDHSDQHEIVCEKRELQQGEYKIKADPGLLPREYSLLDEKELSVRVDRNVASPDSIVFFCEIRILVNILYKDEQGNKIALGTHNILKPGVHSIYPHPINLPKGYVLSSPNKKLVSVTPQGAKPNPVIFVYKDTITLTQKNDKVNIDDTQKPSGDITPLWRFSKLLINTLIAVWLLLQLLYGLSMTNALEEISRELPVLNQIISFIARIYFTYGQNFLVNGQNLIVSGYGSAITFLTFGGTILILMLSVFFGKRMLHRTSILLRKWLILILAMETLLFWTVISLDYYFFYMTLQDKLVHYFRFLSLPVFALLLTLITQAISKKTKR